MGTLPVEEAKEVTYQILDAVHQMHKNNFAHRDLKPGVSTTKVRISRKRLRTDIAEYTYQIETTFAVVGRSCGLWDQQKDSR